MSTIKIIPYDSLNLILIDYYAGTSKYTYSDSLKFYSESAINAISKKYNISRRKIASLIFSFKYEMLSKEEILESETESQAEQQDLPDNPY
jgi:hypothetical protein